jgi:hypothetical protein
VPGKGLVPKNSPCSAYLMFWTQCGFVPMRKLARKDELRPHKRGDAQFPWADEMANAAGQWSD